MKNLKLLRLSLWEFRNKYIPINKVFNLCLNILVFLFSLKTLNKKKYCDILFLVTNDFQFSKLGPFYKDLSKKYNVKHLYKKNRFDVLRKRNLILKKKKFNFFLFDECYANYITTKFNPKIIISQLDGDPFVYFLKKNLSQKNSYLINIAHAISRNSVGASMIDYHYYFIFGKSSLENLKKNKKLFGSCKVLLVGKFDKNEKKKIKKKKERNKIIFFSQYLGSHNNYYLNEKLKAFKLIEEWAHKTNNIIYIKLHPFEDSDYWYNSQKVNKNIFVLNKNVTMKKALSETKIGFILWSNASIDLAYNQIPFIHINPSYLNIGENYLGLDKFFGRRCKNVEDINRKITNIKKFNKSNKLQNLKFLRYHLAKTSSEKTKLYSIKIIDQIMKNKLIKSSINLKGINL